MNYANARSLEVQFPPVMALPSIQERQGATRRIDAIR